MRELSNHRVLAKKWLQTGIPCYCGLMIVLYMLQNAQIQREHEPLTIKALGYSNNQSVTEIFQTIENLNKEKLHVYKKVKGNDEAGKKILSRVRFLVSLQRRQGNLSGQNKFSSDMNKLSRKLSKIDGLIENIGVDLRKYNEKDWMKRRETIINSFHDRDVIKKKYHNSYPFITADIEELLSKIEKEEYEQFLKKKISLLVNVINIEKKIQYEINRYKIIDSDFNG